MPRSANAPSTQYGQVTLPILIGIYCQSSKQPRQRAGDHGNIGCYRQRASERRQFSCRPLSVVKVDPEYPTYRAYGSRATGKIVPFGRFADPIRVAPGEYQIGVALPRTRHFAENKSVMLYRGEHGHIRAGQNCRSPRNKSAAAHKATMSWLRVSRG